MCNECGLPQKLISHFDSWFTIRIDALSGLFIVGLAAYLVYGGRGVSPSNTGYSLNVAGQCALKVLSGSVPDESLAVMFGRLIMFWIRIFNQFEVNGNR